MGGSDRQVSNLNGLGGGSGSGVVSRIDSPVPGERSGTPVQGGDRVSVAVPLARLWPRSYYCMVHLLTSQPQGRAIDDFIQEFKAARKTYHKRAIWAERWSRGEVAWRDD